MGRRERRIPLRATVREQPLTSLAIAVGAGAFLALLLRSADPGMATRIAAAMVVLGLIGLLLIVFGVWYLAFALAAALAPSLGVAGGAAVTGGVLVGPVFLWAIIILLLRRPPPREAQSRAGAVAVTVRRHRQGNAVDRHHRRRPDGGGRDVFVFPQKSKPEPAFGRFRFLFRAEKGLGHLGYALMFLLLALVAGYLGFFGLAGLAAGIAKVLLIVFLILLIVSAFSSALRNRPPV